MLTTSLTKLRFWNSTFGNFIENVPKLGPQRGSQNLLKSIKNQLLIAGVPLGTPEEPKATKMEPKGAKMTPRGPQNDKKYQVLGNKMSATNGTTKKKYLDNTIPHHATRSHY